MSKLDTHQLQELLNGVANKNEEKFNGLYTEYKGIVYGIAFSMVKNKENAEDVAQVVMAKIWDMKPENLPTSHAATWLYTLTKNETLNFIRKQKKTVSLEDIYYIGEEDASLDSLMEKETYNKILSRLEPQEQEIVSLKVVSGLSFREIANLLEMPIGTVQWKYYKSIHTLKLLLGNLSMFIVTVFAYVISKTRKGKKEDIKEDTSITNTTTEIEKVPEDATSRDEEKAEANKVSATPIANELTNTNEITENVVEVIEEPVPETPPFMEAGMLGIACFFLILTILFVGIFAKHQQNRKKNVSK